MTRTERLDKIQQVLEENLDLIWVDRTIYNHHTKIYRTADIFDFADNRHTYVYLRDSKNKGYLARVILNDEKFIINMNGMKIDVSEHWKELLSEELVTPSIK